MHFFLFLFCRVVNDGISYNHRPKLRNNFGSPKILYNLLTVFLTQYNLYMTFQFI